MNNKKNQTGKKNMKPLVILLAMVLLVACAVGGTLAWLTAKSQDVTNTFTAGDINIVLNETDPNGNAVNAQSFKMVPGHVIDKDPVVTVKGGSEDCWVFVEIVEDCTVTGYDFDDFIKYNVDLKDEGGNGNFEKLTGVQGVDNVYYLKATDITADRTIKILAGGNLEHGGHKYEWDRNQVLVLPTVTKGMMDALEAEGAKLPTLTFKAYAVQLYKSNGVAFSAEEAWGIANPAANP